MWTPTEKWLHHCVQNAKTSKNDKWHTQIGVHNEEFRAWEVQDIKLRRSWTSDMNFHKWLRMDLPPAPLYRAHENDQNPYITSSDQSSIEEDIASRSMRRIINCEGLATMWRPWDVAMWAFYPKNGNVAQFCVTTSNNFERACLNDEKSIMMWQAHRSTLHGAGPTSAQIWERRTTRRGEFTSLPCFATCQKKQPKGQLRHFASKSWPI